jgi:serine/threonine protein kinase
VIGKSLGQYQVLAKLGEGGMGEVYLARDARLGRDVALKVVPEAFLSDPDRIVRFEREAKMLAALNHPHIAALLSMEEADGRHFLVMELVPGQTLAEQIQHGRLPLSDTLDVARQVADALAAAHEQGIIHRDLKPANVLLTPCRDRTGPDGGPTTKFSTGISASREGPHHARTARRLAITCLGVDEPGLLERVTGRPAVALEHLASASDRWRTVGNDWGLAFSLVEDAEAALDD